MKMRLLAFVIASLFSSCLFANGTDPVVTLCSGKKMTWEDYQLYKQLYADEYDIEINYMSTDGFSPFHVAVVNNTEGAWSSVIPMPLVAAAAGNLPDGRIMTWSAKDKLAFGGNLGRTWTAIFDPSNNTSTEFLIEQTGHDMFCPGTSTLPDGRIIVSGGSSSNKTTIYDPFTSQWSTGDELNITRGYHSSVTLASGATFIIGGSWSGGVGNKHAEVWSEKTGWYRLPGVPVETITDGIDSPQNPQKDDYFPWLWVAPNGKLFHAGPSPSMHWIDPTGVGTATYAGQRGNDGYSINGTSVMYDVGKILKTGGAGTFEDNSPALASTYTIDINSDTPVSTQVGDLNQSRNFHSTVVLPNGEVMVIGGIPVSAAFSDNNSRMIPEIWNPGTGQWTQMAAMSVPRNYHSVSLLMTDGRVFTAGGGLCNTCATNHPDAQIFSPPYLFNANGTLATRPVITSAPGTSNYNSNITVNTNAGISSFSLVRLSSTTHSTNNEQRRIPLTQTNLGGNQYQLAIPNRNILPPGRYMLFAMNNAGTPSVASIIKIGDDINDCTPQSNPNPGGIGLQATYFNNADLTNQVYTQTDATVDFNWGTGAPNNVGNESFSIRWEGDIEVPRSGTYSFYTNSDDGVRLWIDGKAIVDNWTDHPATEDIGLIHLEPNQKYSILLEYYEQSGGAQIQLRWSGPGIGKEIIPSQNLFPPGYCSQAGNPCNDNDPCTINDTYDAACNCIGTFEDSDGDGTCDANDLCPNLNDNLIGSSCDDGNPNTDNDIYQSDCSCAGTPSGGGGDCSDVSIVAGAGNITVSGLNAPVTQVQIFDPSWNTVLVCAGNCNTTEVASGLGNGTYYVKVTLYTATWAYICDIEEFVNVGGGGGGCTDNDNDGVCADQDCNDNNASLPAAQGTPCNDGNPNTTNDVIQADGCSCAGTPTGGGADCSTISITSGAGSITVGGLTAAISQVQIFNPVWSEVLNCSGNCNNTETASNLSDGTYYVKVRFYTANWGFICEVDEFVTVGGGGGGGCTDNDNDGICADQDCNDNDPGLPANQGTSCNDNNPNTDNDVIQADGCTCAGTPSGGGGGNDCDNINISFNGADLSISGLNATPVSIVHVFNSQWQTVFTCTGDCNPTETITGLSNDTYFVKTTLYTAAWAQICVTESYVTGGSNGLIAQQEQEDFFFTAQKNDRAVNLYWVSNTEYKNKAFYIERSLDGQQFETIGELTSIHENWNTHFNYSGNDANPSKGINYYRIKKLHHDGSFEYSAVRQVAFDIDLDHFTIFPNPAATEVYVNLKKYSGSKGTVAIYNNLGEMMVQTRLDRVAAEPLRFDIEAYTSGLYLIVVKMEGHRLVTQKLIVSRL